MELHLLMHIKKRLLETLVPDGNAQKLAKIAGAIKEIVEEHSDKVFVSSHPFLCIAIKSKNMTVDVVTVSALA